MLKEFKIEESNGTKSYKSVETMKKALEKYKNKDLRYMVYNFPSGRVTPVFIGADALCMIHYGYYVVG